MTFLSIRTAMIAVLLSMVSPAIAAPLTFESDLVLSGETFAGAFVETDDGTLLVDDENVEGEDNEFGFAGRFSNLGSSDTVTLSLVFETDETDGANTRLLSCDFGGLSCLDRNYPFTALPDANGEIAIGKADGPDLFIGGNLRLGETITFAELFAETGDSDTVDGTWGFYTDYFAYFTVASTTFAASFDNEIAEVPIPASAPLLPAAILLLLALHGRRRA